MPRESAMNAALIATAVLSLLPTSGAPDRPARPGEWGYRPRDGQTVSVNPPPFTWVHDPQAAHYIVQWSSDPHFNHASSRVSRWCVYTHDTPLKPGHYAWRYRVIYRDGSGSTWSRPRRFVVPPDAVTFPKPGLEQLKRRIPANHPRLFFRSDELHQWRRWAMGPGRAVVETLRREADKLIQAGPTPEPTVLGTTRNPETRAYWWPNRVQTLKACLEAETIALVYLLTGNERYGHAARRWVLHLASWNPDGPTNFRLNCEAAKPLLHRLPRAYDWAFDVLSEEERDRVRAVMRRRALDAWRSGEVREGNGHLSRPYSSHGNRTWHKLAECAIALLDEVPEAETWLDYAVNKFYAAYPVWSDDDGGWHEGLSYWAGYMSKFVWWSELAEHTLRIDCFRKPYFAHVGDYAIYTAPPGSPDMGFGDLSYRPPSSRWSFVPYFAAKTKNAVLAWWAKEWGMRLEATEPLLRVLWARLEPPQPRPPVDLPPGKLFRGTGVAVLNTTLRAAANNVQIRFKASPMGRQSHGHDPHNAFTLNAYGDQLLVNCVYRDWHGSPFHTQWCWSTRAQNALLVNGHGQKRHTAEPLGRIVAWETTDSVQHVAGEAAEAYGGLLRRFTRHMLLIKPQTVLLVDELEANERSTFQWMFHALGRFSIDSRSRQVTLIRPRARMRIRFYWDGSLALRQWSGYEPAPDVKFLRGRRFPTQWHLEVASREPKTRGLFVAVMELQPVGFDPPFDGVRVEAGADAYVVRVRQEQDHAVVVRVKRSSRAEPEEQAERIEILECGEASPLCHRRPSATLLPGTVR